MKTKKWCLLSALMLVVAISGCGCDDVEPAQREVCPSNSLIEAESPVSVHGGNDSLVTVTVLDEDGEPISGVEVVLEGSRGGQDLVTQPSAPTGEDGIAEGRVASTVVGETTISAVAGGVDLEATAEVVFIDEQACPEGQVYCGPETGCVELGTLEHCSTCHDACEAPENAEAHCNGGCGWTCVDGFASCDDDPETGCETELGTVDDCLSCGHECEAPENATPVCDALGCDFVCDEGWGICDGDPGTGCEEQLVDGECPPKDCPDGLVDCGAAGCVELGTADHCLDCHDACATPDNAVAVCGPYGCTFECLEGFGNCDNDPETGCEEALDEDGLCPSGCLPGEADCGDGCVPLDTIDNCGECGRSCDAADNADPTCLPTGCSFVCHDGFGNCDGDPETGCEQPLDDDLHCGACGAACEDPPNASGFCEDGVSGQCGYTCDEGFVDCDGDPETGCETDLSVATCCDYESFVAVTSPCLVAGAGGLSVIHIEIRDPDGQRIPGAEVTLDAGGLPVLEDVVESQAEPGVYLALVEAPEAAGDHEVGATATYDGEWVCGAQVTVAPVTVEVAPPVPHAGGGTGGCIPRGGNLRVRAIDEDGHPLPDAFVMVGPSAGDEEFHSDYEAFLSGGTPDLSNTLFTDEDGYAVFFDLGDALEDPSLMITAGAADRAYASVVGFDASDVVLVLESLAPPPERLNLLGTVVPEYHSNLSSQVALALVTESLNIEALSRFDFMEMLEADKDVRVGGTFCLNPMDLVIPGNIHFPDQMHLGCDLQAAPPDWVLTPLRGDQGDVLDLATLQGEIHILDAIDVGEDLPALISAMAFKQVGMRFDVPADQHQSNLEIELTADLDATMPVEVSNAPEGELWVLSVGDIDGLVGEGRLFLQGVEVEDPASSLSGHLTTAEPEGPFDDVSHLAMALTMVAGQGASAVMDRVNTDRSTPRVLDEFFNPPGAASVTGRTFSWLDVSSTSSPPDYHVARSVLRRVTPPPDGAYKSEEEAFWTIYSPAGVRGFTLPTLPPQAPRAPTGYLVPAWNQDNIWFLGLYYLGLSASPAALDAGDIGFSDIEPDLTHMSITRRRM